ncbi:hypothetical protein PGTUg99_002465 [Puccinia graminis f. sp. tritici]|uniref:Uncharacterized protein n=1 Tax=Puccinia graminis f. sp. tritici TaxID=56615 RepID=A0A5B0SHW5_PUCGR|nr:hypothetical protein PGTUg99_002465 [Puccinia graminis f. sp. tritici]
MAADRFQEKRRLFEQVNLLATSLERATKKDDLSFWKVFAAQAEAGRFNNLEPFKGLIMAVAIRNERERQGKALTGVQFSASFDDFMMTLAAISPRGAQLLRETFAGRTLRSQRHIRAKNSLQLADGLSLMNFERVSSILKDLNYTGPLAIGSDQTVCLKSLRTYNGFLVGAQGGDVKFDTEEKLKEITERIILEKSLCSKLRAYTIQVPLPGIPTYVVALLASKDKENSTDIIETHKQVLYLCNQAGMKIISISSDGAANELSAQMEVVNLSDSHLVFSRPKQGIDIKIPLVGSPPLPLVGIQDPKHARKTSVNQLLSGARLLCFGKYWFSILHLLVIVESENSSLYVKDIFNSDKQDDGRAYRVMNEFTLKIALEHEECTGLAIYLFILGELCDSWLNQTMSHFDRIVSAYTSHFFLARWHQYLREQENSTNGVMSFNRNGISHQSHKIFSTLADSLLGLILSHREFYPDTPLMPWKHGTEACEHIFGWMRVILPNFTVLDARQMMPKIFIIVKSIMSGKVKMPKSDHIHSGYQYSFSDSVVFDPKLTSALKKFPNDNQIDELLKLAKNRAETLIKFTGMQEVPSEDSSHSSPGPSFDNDDVSFSITKQYYFKSQPAHIDNQQTNNLQDAIAEAALIAGDRCALDHELISQEETHELLETETVKTSRMTIQSLLNPQVSKTQIPMSIVNLFDFERQSSLKWVTHAHELHQDNLICHRHDHDSEIQLHHGNERKRCQNIVQTNTSESNKLDAKSCSKIVAICLRDADAKHNTLARMHRWNIPTQLDLKRLATNTSAALDLTVHSFMTTGEVDQENPLEPGKFAVVIKKGSLFIGKILGLFCFNNGRHDYIRESPTRSKLSYIHVQLFNYTDSSPAALGYKHSAPDRFIFAHINTHDVHFLFRRTAGMNITQPDATEACVWVPSVLRPMLSAMSDPMYLQKVEHDIKVFQKALK